MPPLSKDQQKFYENAIEMAKRHIDEIDAKIEEELSRIKERLAELQNEKKNVRSIYDSACAMLGVENELEKREDAEGAEEVVEA
jgi:F0F1-type ATP synthase membrane subunit b/b'